MNSTVKYVLTFVGGAAAGVAVSWKILKTKYKKIADEEIASVKEKYKKRDSEISKHIDEILTPHYENFDEKDIEEYEALAHEYGDVQIGTSKPYVISPEEFGEIDDYDKETLYWYADEVLMDDDDNPIEDIDGLVGSDSLLTFGRYEDDSVFVRNDKYKTDYEILLCLHKSFEVNRRTNE